MQTDGHWWRRLFPAALAVLPALAPAQAPAASAEARKALAERISQDLEALAANSQGLRTTPFTPQDVVAAVGREPGKLFAWMQQHTRWVPYRGCLRGARGVLADGTGNSLDRALLLGELLRCAGFEVRLARTSLDAATATPLLANWAATARFAPPDELQPQFDRGDEDALALVAGASRQLLAACGDAPQPPAVDVLAALQDHWWVQLAENGAFRDFDLQAGEAGKALAAPVSTINATARGFAIAAVDAQSVLLRVVIEQLAAGKRTESTVLSADLRPADQVAAPVELSFYSFSWPQGLTVDGSPAALAALRQALIAEKEWMPILQIGKERIAKASFDATGKVDEHPALDGGAKMGQAVGRGFEGLVDVGTDKHGPAGMLTALWLEFEVRVPGSPPVTLRHELFDLLGPAVRASGKLPEQLAPSQQLGRALRLLSTTEILPLAGHLPGALAVRTDLEAKLALRQRARSLIGIEAPEPFKAAFRSLAFDALMQSPALAFATLRSGLGNFRKQLYLDRPNLVCSRRQTEWDGGATEPHSRVLIDVLANEVAVLPGFDPRKARLEQGAIDTVAEELAIDSEPGDSANTMAVCVQAAAHGIELVTLRSVDDLAKVAPTWPADAAARARSELLAGCTLLAASAPVPIHGTPELGWWRIDAGTGSAIGMMASGFHQDTTETAITSPLQQARRLLEFLAKPGNAGKIYRLRNGSNVVGNLAEEWEIIGQIQQRAVQALWDGFGVIG